METTDAETTTVIASPYELANWAMVDYYKRTGIEPYKADHAEILTGIITIRLYDEDGNVLDIYNVDKVSGIGNDYNGEEILLPQTGNNDPIPMIIFVISAVVALAGAVIILRSRETNGRNANR